MKKPIKRDKIILAAMDRVAMAAYLPACSALQFSGFVGTGFDLAREYAQFYNKQGNTTWYSICDYSYSKVRDFRLTALALFLVATLEE